MCFEVLGVDRFRGALSVKQVWSLIAVIVWSLAGYAAGGSSTSLPPSFTEWKQKQVLSAYQSLRTRLSTYEQSGSVNDYHSVLEARQVYHFSQDLEFKDYLAIQLRRFRGRPSAWSDLVAKMDDGQRTEAALVLRELPYEMAGRQKPSEPSLIRSTAGPQVTEDTQL
ncbi:MAG: hypothetical protein CL675_08910 [Bdellovibrionaceae bacterium]|nr:hypothetical protein [Pseudobdellovibrionaceae bacterium]